nr:ChaN family lipoprotein [Amylibacter sp.]
MTNPRMPYGHWIDPNTAQHTDGQGVIARAAKAPAVLLGEHHDRADHHLWQLEVSRQIFAQRVDIVMGFEMFPARLDPVLAEWSAGRLEEPAFLERAEWGTVWGFDAALYLPLFRFCKDHNIPMIGLNCRRGLVREVGAQGWDAIPPQDREGLTEARAATPAYRKYLFEITGGLRKGRAAQSPSDPAFDRFVRAQQTWDRAFACRIAAVAQRPDPPLVIGIIGRGHLEYYHGTPFQLDDLGVSGSVVLLPTDGGCPVAKQIADEVYCLE